MGSGPGVHGTPSKGASNARNTPASPWRERGGRRQFWSMTASSAETANEPCASRPEACPLGGPKCDRPIRTAKCPCDARARSGCAGWSGRFEWEAKAGRAGVSRVGNVAGGVEATVLRTSDLDYDLPPGLIATAPAAPRDAARLMVVSRASGEIVRHAAVRELASLLTPGDLLVFNATRVLRARFVGARVDTGGSVEGLYLGPAQDYLWRVLLRAKRPREGRRIRLHGREGGELIELELVSAGVEAGEWLVRPLDGSGCVILEPAAAILERVGLTPLPPYILRARNAEGKSASATDDLDRVRYQTVFAQPGAGGSVAAPTAGLHFTLAMLAQLEQIGVERTEVILHVGTGTFRTVETEYVEQHPMHEEWCSMPAAAIASIVRAKAQGRRVIAVGTTAARTLEAYAEQMASGGRAPESLATRILITPGRPWRWVDGLLTNFHLPRSTLMAMVGAMFAGGVPTLTSLYADAIARGYRFYSFGDAMLIV